MNIRILGWGLDSLIRETWKYGFVFIGQYVTEKTINYITKYMYKKDEKHPTFTGKVLCSARIGAQYTTRADAKNNKYKGEETKETYRCRNGAKINLPIYYRNKIYTEEKTINIKEKKQKKLTGAETEQK